MEETNYQNQMIDSHCHLDLLDLSPFNGDLGQALELAKSKGVMQFLCVSVSLDKFPKLVAIAEQYPDIYLSVGSHPSETETVESTALLLTELSKHPLVIAIGETGLDYHYNKGDLEWQRTRFRTHIAVAKALNKPLIVHTRDAREDTIAILKEEGAATVGGVMHCFTETLEMAQAAIELGFYISFSGIVTFKNATELQAVAKQVPLERVLIETDAPYLSPIPYRGKPNHPANVYYVAEYIANLRGITLEEVANATTENFKRLFKRSI